jgi:hypothetical protein
MDHLKRSNDFIDLISEVISRYNWEFNTHGIRNRMCNDLKSLFDYEFDEYWQQISDIHPNDLSFIDLTTPEIVNQSQYHIGVSIRNQDPIPFSDFITEYFGRESIRDRKIKEILG